MLKAPDKYNLDQVWNDNMFLANRASRLEDLVLEYVKASNEQLNFITTEILKAEVSIIRFDDKVTKDFRYKMSYYSDKLKELETCMKGFIQYYHQHLDKIRIKDTYKYSSIKEEGDSDAEPRTK